MSDQPKPTEVQQLREQLADRHKLCVDFETKWKAEREKSRVLGNMTDGFRIKLAAAQAAMIDPCPICGKELRHYNTCPQKHKDTAALDATIAAAQQPLVALLHRALPCVNKPIQEQDRLRCDIADALAQVKDGK